MQDLPLAKFDSKIIEVIDSFTNDNKLFTAWDITVAFREKVGSDVNIKHNDVRSFINDYFQTGNMPSYDRAVINFSLKDGSKINARLYHPHQADILSYYGFETDLKDKQDKQDKSKISGLYDKMKEILDKEIIKLITTK